MRITLVAAILFAAACGSSPQLGRPQDEAVTPYRRAEAGSQGPRSGRAPCLADMDPDDGSAAPPSRLSQTGCFADLSDFTPAAHVSWFGVNSELYSDGAHKLRFMALPVTATLDLNQSLEVAPVGMVLIKVFELTAAGAESPNPVEIRFMHKHNRGWRIFTYRWNAQLQDGELLHERQVVPMDIQDVNAAAHIDYLYPGEADCRMCHNPATPFILGPRPEQLDGQFYYQGQLRRQLEVLADAGYVKAATVSTPAWPDPLDPEAGLEGRARSYLATNCSHCHTPGGTTTAALTLDLRYETTLADSHLCDEVQYFADAGTLRIARGDPDSSWIVRRLEAHGKMRMPPLGLNLHDRAGIGVLRDWIAQMTSCP